MPITLREVAKAAGVSTAAASKVLHGRGDSVRVSEQKAEIIRKIAKQMDYRPNAVARNLRSSRTHTIGLIWENFTGMASGPLYFTYLLDGVGSGVIERHYRLTILPELKHEDVLAALGDGQLEGVVWCKLAKDEATLNLIHQSPIPIVALNAPAPLEATDAVFISCDNEAGMELAVDHLWSLGHRRIAFLNEEEEVRTPDCIARRAGVAAALRRRGSDLRPEDALTWSWRLDQFADWWASEPGPTAIVCWSERCGSVLLKRAQEIGVRVPRDLSVVGFDSTQFCETTQPRLTAVSQPIGKMARHATDTLFDMIAGHRPETHSFIFPCSLDVRDSTAPPSLKAEEEIIP